LFADGQSESRSLVFCGCGFIDLAEGLEEFRKVFFGDADTGIGDVKVDHVFTIGSTAGIDVDYYFTIMCEFNGIA
jgi:hypothetical protein